MISLVTAVMNRLDRINPFLKSWIDCPEIEEIIIVDWSSNPPIKDTCLAFNNKKIKVIRVNGESSFVSLCHSFNVGVLNSSTNQILRVDIDYQLKDTKLFSILKKKECNVFYTGIGTNIKNFCFINKSSFIEVNGYNEKLIDYGYENFDFFERLKKSGYEMKNIDDIYKYIHHMPHDDKLRTENFTEKDTKISYMQNKVISGNMDCGIISKYHILQNEFNYIELKRKND